MVGLVLSVLLVVVVVCSLLVSARRLGWGGGFGAHPRMELACGGGVAEAEGEAV